MSTAQPIIDVLRRAYPLRFNPAIRPVYNRLVTLLEGKYADYPDVLAALEAFLEDIRGDETTLLEEFDAVEAGDEDDIQQAVDSLDETIDRVAPGRRRQREIVEDDDDMMIFSDAEEDAPSRSAKKKQEPPPPQAPAPSPAKPQAPPAMPAAAPRQPACRRATARRSGATTKTGTQSASPTVRRTPGSPVAWPSQGSATTSAGGPAAWTRTVAAWGWGACTARPTATDSRSSAQPSCTVREEEASAKSPRSKGLARCRRTVVPWTSHGKRESQSGCTRAGQDSRAVSETVRTSGWVTGILLSKPEDLSHSLHVRTRHR